MKNNKQLILEKNYYWVTPDKFPEPARETLLSAANSIQTWMLNQQNNEPALLLRLNQKIGTIVWKPSNFIWRKVGFHHVEFQTVFIDPHLITIESAVHEFAHILDNRLGAHRMATLFGGGPADEMVRAIGVEPDTFLPRFHALNYEKTLLTLDLELNPTTYGRSMGPAEDFAESFRLAVLHPDQLHNEAPNRFTWFVEWRKRLTK